MDFEELANGEEAARVEPQGEPTVFDLGPSPSMAHSGYNFGWPFGDGNKRTFFFQEGSNVLFRGAGPGITHIQPNVKADNATIQVGNVKNATLTLQGMTIHCGTRAAIHAGLEHPGYLGSLHLRLIDCEIIADTPEDGYGHTSLWGIFGYNLRLTMERVKFRCKHTAEHGIYIHNPLGASIRHCEVFSTGSEGFKFTNRAHEGAPAPKGARIHIKGCTIRDWHQPWAWRGGAGIVVQGAQCDVLVEDTIVEDVNGSGRCIMIDDGGDDRPVDGSSPNGWFLMRRSGAISRAGNENYPPMMRIGSLNFGSQDQVVTGALIKNCGVWGWGSSLQVDRGAIPHGRFKVEGCNTKFIAGAAAARGLTVPSTECVIPLSDRLKPLSEGHSA